MNPESTQVDQVVGATAVLTEASVAAAPVAVISTPTTQEPTAPVSTPVRPPGGTLRLTFKLRLEDTSEVLLDLDDSVDFRHGPYRQSIAIVGDQVRKVFEALVAEPLLTTVNQYVRLKLDNGHASPAAENPDVSPFPKVPSPNAIEADGRPFRSSDHS
ncbi:MAG TPA: hypothetical protein VN708_26530 [Terriglobales bacterium]|nr:hypothetical protein [Terriglobales bacterium]